MPGSVDTSTPDLDALIRGIPGYDPVATAAPGDYFDADAAAMAIGFFTDCIRHVKGRWRGKPFELEGWQAAVHANIFGWRRADGTRRYRYVLIYVPRKNGKTAYAAGLGVQILVCDGEPGAEIYAAAAERAQAGILHNIAKQMVQLEPELDEVLEVYQHSIALPGLDSSFKAISAEASTKHGFNAHACIVDELHAQPDRELVDTLDTSMGARSQPLMVYITTADFAGPSICNEVVDYARKVRDGSIEDPEFLPVIYELPKELGHLWDKPEGWRIANPNIGVSFSEEYIAKKVAKAKRLPAYENTVKRLYLNMQTEQAERWLAMDQWDACRGPEEFMIVDGVDPLLGEKCWAGLDLSATSDLTAFVLVFRRGDLFIVRPWFFCPRERADYREIEEGVPYLRWAEEGWVELTEGRAVRQAVVFERVLEIASRYRVQEVAVDRWNAEYMMQNLGDEGLEIVAFGQGYASMSEPSKLLESLYLEELLAHGGNPVLRWMAGNAARSEDPAGNIKPDKKRSGDRIDGIVAMIMALGRANRLDDTGMGMSIL